MFLLSFLPHGLNDGLHLLPLPLGQKVGSDTLKIKKKCKKNVDFGIKLIKYLLEELEASLFLPDPEELLSATFIRCESHDFTNQVADKLVVLGQLALGIKEISSDFLFYLVSSLCGMIKY